MANSWVNHVKEYASSKGIKYFDALKDPECKASYTKTSPLNEPNVNYKRTSPWIEHVKSFALSKGIKYFDALKDPECKASYMKTGSGIPPIRNMTPYGKPQSVDRPVLNMTRYGRPGTFTHEDARKIDQADKERSAMKKAMVNSVTY